MIKTNLMTKFHRETIMGKHKSKVLHNVHMPINGDFNKESYCFVMYASGYDDIMNKCISSNAVNHDIYPFYMAAELEVEERKNKENLSNE